MFINTDTSKLERLAGAPDVNNIIGDYRKILDFSKSIASVRENIGLDESASPEDFQRDAFKKLMDTAIEATPFDSYQILLFEDSFEEGRTARVVYTTIDHRQIGDIVKIPEVGPAEIVRKHKRIYYELGIEESFEETAKALNLESNTVGGQLVSPTERVQNYNRKEYENEIAHSRKLKPIIEKVINLKRNAENMEFESLFQKFKEADEYLAAKQIDPNIDFALDDIFRQIDEKGEAIYEVYRIKTEPEDRAIFSEMTELQWSVVVGMPLLAVNKKTKEYLVNGIIVLSNPKFKGEETKPFTDYELGRTELFINTHASTILKHYQELTDERALRQELIQVNADLKSAQDQLIKTEKDTLKLNITKGIVHDYRNLLVDVGMDLKGVKRPYKRVDSFITLIDSASEISDQASLEIAINNIKNHPFVSSLGTSKNKIGTMSRTIAKMETLLSSFESGNDYDLQPIKFESVIDDVLNSYAVHLSGTNLSKNYTTADYAINGDAYQLERAVTNIVSNFNEATGETMDRTLEIKTEVEGDNLRVYFKDNGPGISEDVQKNLFDPYFSTKDELKESRQRGLGLFNVKTILEGHSGLVGVNSEVGKGTEFYFEIPLKK